MQSTVLAMIDSVRPSQSGTMSNDSRRSCGLHGG